MNRFKECREEANLSQKFVAIHLGIAAPSVSCWESGRNMPSSENIARLAKLYGVSADYLIGHSDIKKPNAASETRIIVDDETLELREQLRRRPSMRILFDAAKTASDDDLRRAVKIIEALKGDAE